MAANNMVKGNGFGFEIRRSDRGNEFQPTFRAEYLDEAYVRPTLRSNQGLGEDSKNNG